MLAATGGPRAFFVLFLVLSGQVCQFTATTSFLVKSHQKQSKPGVSETSAKRMASVVSALQDLLASIESEEKEEAANYKCYVQWCDSSIKGKEKEIDENESQLEDNKVAVDQFTAKISMLERTLQKNKDESAETSDALEQATAIRDKDNKKYLEEKDNNMVALKSLAQAIKILRKANAEGDFLQQGISQHSPGDSKVILGTFTELEKTMQKTQAEADAEEAKHQGIYDELAADKRAQLAALLKEFEKKAVILTDVKTSLAQASNDIEDTTEALQENQLYLKETVKACDEKKAEWQIRSEDRAKEKSAIREAISFLTITAKEGGASLLQRSSQSANGGDDDDDSQLSFLQAHDGELSRSTSMDVAADMLDGTDADVSSLLSTADTKARDEIFKKVKITITDLIEVLQSEQTDEKEKKDLCEAELGKKGATKAKTEDKVGLLTASMESKQNDVNTLSDELAEIKRLMKESKKEDETASKLRQEQKKIFDAGTKDRKMAIKVLNSAKAVLQKFYASQEGLVQKSSKVSQSAPEVFQDGSARHTGTGNIVIAMIEKIIGDVGREQVDAQKEENAAVAEYTEHMQASTAEMNERYQLITEKATRRARVKVWLGNTREELDSTKDKLDKVVEQLTALHSDCDELLKNFKKRTKARDFEIAQLRDVFDILSGSSVAARTGFLDNDLAADQMADDREVSQLQGMSRTTSDISGKVRRLLGP